MSIHLSISVIDGRKAEHERAGLDAIISILWDKGLVFDEASQEKESKIISETGVIAAMVNPYSALELMNILLDKGDTEGSTIRITESVLKCAICNSLCPREMVELLFQRRSADIHITSSFFEFLDIGNNRPRRPGGIDVIIRKTQPTELLLDESTVAALPRTVDCETMDLILRTHAKTIRVTEQMLEEAASNPSGADMIRLLYHRREPGTEVSEVLLGIATENNNGLEILEFLLENLGLNTHSITAEVLRAAAATRKNPLEKMEILLEKLGPGTQLPEDVTVALVKSDLAMMNMVLNKQLATFVVSERVLKAAVARRKNPVEMLQLLINNAGSNVQITEDIVCAAAGNDSHPAVMEFLIELEGPSLRVTEDVLVAAVQSYKQIKSANMVELLLHHAPDTRITERVFLEAGNDPRALRVLLNHSHDHFPSEMVITEMGRGKYGLRAGKVLDILLERQLVTADNNEELIETLACNAPALTALLAHNPETSITEKALVRAAEEPPALRLLLLQAIKSDNENLITEEVMKVAARSNVGVAPIESILDRVTNPDSLITNNVLKEALCHGQPDVPEFLLNRCQQPDLIDIQSIWDDIWQDRNLRWIEKMRPMDILQKISFLRLNESILRSYPYDPEQKVDSGFDDVIVYLCDCETIHLTEESAEIILERCGNQAVERFLDYMSGIEIKESFFLAADRNQRADKERLVATREEFAEELINSDYRASYMLRLDGELGNEFGP
ncbi:hypothetical protein BDW69DRAFT_183161 [Aspergillus filifer]